MKDQTMADDRVIEELEWKTNRNKTLQVVLTNPYGFMKFQFKEGGRIPMALEGSFTTFKDIKELAERWMSIQPPKPHTQVKKEAKEAKDAEERVA